MAQYVYKGLTETEKEALVKAHTAGIVPPEQRGQPLRYRIDKDDSEEEREVKRKLSGDWKKARVKETQVEVDNIDKAMKIGSFVFEKGRPVDVPEDNVEIVKKLDALCGIGKPKSASRRAWEKLPEVISPPQSEKSKGK
jgi:hypothetical protein